ncbi:MAG TPA: alpha/beta hydrolase, partial [Anaerolineae bacterium]|nr:alpha/beta hydrolase [Anaerolineae bacterium]
MSTPLPLHQYGPPQAPPIMLLHPGGALHTVWLPLIRAWRGQYHLLAPDLLPPDNPHPSLHTLATHIITLLQQQNEPTWLIGASLGANVALLATSRAPNLVAGLILDSAQVGGP